MPVAKPAAGTAPNVGHALSPDYGCWLLTGTSPEIDTVGSASAPLNGSGHSVSTNPNGEPCRAFNGSGDLYPISGLASAPAGAATFICRLYLTALGSYQTIYAGGANGFYIDNANQFRAYSNPSPGASQTTGTWYTLGWSRDGSGNTQYYIDGVAFGLSGTSGIAFPTTTGIGGHGSERLSGRIDYIHLYGRQLTALEHAAIHSDPFQMFAAAGGGSFNALMIAP